MAESLHPAVPAREAGARSAPPRFVLYVEFRDGVARNVDLSPSLFRSVFEPLRDEAYFQRVVLDAFGAPCWPNGADLAPDALYRQLRARTTEHA